MLENKFRGRLSSESFKKVHILSNSSNSYLVTNTGIFLMLGAAN